MTAFGAIYHIPSCPLKSRGDWAEARSAARKSPECRCWDAAARQALQRIAVARIHPNPYQPRVEFKPNELAELEASLRTNGLLQPIVVRLSLTATAMN